MIAAAAAAKSLQSCPTLCNPRDSSSSGSPVPGILQARTLEWVVESTVQSAKIFQILPCYPHWPLQDSFLSRIAYAEII